jgi:hypothetical protein
MLRERPDSRRTAFIAGLRVSIEAAERSVLAREAVLCRKKKEGDSKKGLRELVLRLSD